VTDVPALASAASVGPDGRTDLGGVIAAQAGDGALSAVLGLPLGLANAGRHILEASLSPEVPDDHPAILPSIRAGVLVAGSLRA